MRTEAEVRKMRDDLYRTAILMRQSNVDIADLVVIFVSQYDWVLGEGNGQDEVYTRFMQYERDRKKLALI